MWSDVLTKLLTYGDYIIFAALITLLISLIASVGYRYMKWNIPTLGIIGIFVGISQIKLLAIAMLLVRLLLYWSMLLFEKSLTFTYICFGAGATLIIHILIVDIKAMIMDFLLTLGIYGSIYSRGLLDSYQHNIQMRTSVLLMELAVAIFTLILTLISVVVCAGYIVSKKKKSIAIKLSRLWPQISLLLIGSIMVILPIYYMNRIDTETIEKNMFQYTEQGLVTYSGKSQVTKSGLGSVIRNNNTMTVLADTPLYVENENKILLPNVISIVQPKISLTNRVANLTWLYEKDGKYYVENDKIKLTVSDFFLYDGKNTYLFFEPVTITWDQNSLELSPFSYINVKYNQSITVFNRETKDYKEITTGICNVMTSMDCGATINLSMDILTKEDGQEQMLFLQPNLLEDLQ